MLKVYSDRTTIMKEHKRVIIGDSSARGYAVVVKNHMADKIEAIGLVNPGVAAVSDIVNLTKVM